VPVFGCRPCRKTASRGEHTISRHITALVFRTADVPSAPTRAGSATRANVIGAFVLPGKPSSRIAQGPRADRVDDRPNLRFCCRLQRFLKSPG